jgi:invasion protein IalB
MTIRHLAALFALALTFLAAPAMAAPQDAVFNKEGVWGIDVDHGACAASMQLPDGSTFLLRGADGEVNVALFARAKLKRGKAGRIETDAGGFDFKPGWSETGVYTEDFIGAPAVATLRAARQVRIVIDDRPVMDVSVADTGFAGAVDAVIACSKGQSGWWGKGVRSAEAGAKAAEAPPPLNKEGFWSVSAGANACFATMNIAGGAQFMLFGDPGGISFSVVTKTMRRGKAGRLQVDAGSFDFTPAYDGKDILFLDDKLNDQALAELHKTKEVAVTVDDRVVMGAKVEGTGLAGVLDAVAACAKGESGWWGKGLDVAAFKASHRPEPVFNGGSKWGIIVADRGMCFVQAQVADGTLEFRSVAGLVGVAVHGRADLPHGTRGRIETDSFKLDFKPDYGGARYLAAADPMDSADLFALRRARWIRVTVDGRPAVDAAVEGTGFPEALDAVAACSKGQAGWWGDGSKPEG